MQKVNYMCQREQKEFKGKEKKEQSAQFVSRLRLEALQGV